MRDSNKTQGFDNVVRMESNNQRMINARLTDLPSAIALVHEKSKHILLDKLKTFFDKADDSLFEMADRAESNQEQNVFFDSMREVRVQRRSIEINFSESIDLAFSSLSSADIPQLNSEVFDTIKTDTLSLVHDDDLEEMVAVDSAAARANSACGEVIQFISLRLDSLVPVKVYQKNNPISPDSICSAFMDQLKRLDISIKAKLVLFRLFDKTVVGGLPDLYEAVNQLLVDQKVMPSLPSGKARAAERKNQEYAAESNEIDNSGLSRQVMETLQAILGQNIQPQGRSGRTDGRDGLSFDGSDNGSNGNRSNRDGSDNGGSEGGGKNSVVASVKLLQLLSNVQHQQANQSYSALGGALGGNTSGGNGSGDNLSATQSNSGAVNVKNLIGDLRSNHGLSGDIGRIDGEVMNLVNMLFEFILEDRNLAPAMKALISRMQIPIIKVAIADKTFFTKGGHIARRLLNEMSTAAIGWSGDEAKALNDPLYKKMDEIVRSLLDDFGSDISVFSELFADFNVFREKEKKRVAVLERRTLDAEDGKAKAEIARKKIAEVIYSRTQKVDLPDVVSKLVNEAWSNVLFVTALKHGFGSDQWKKTLRTMDELIWSSLPPESDKQRQTLIRLVPSLLKKLRAGLDTISFNPFEMSNLFKALEDVHLSCIRGRIGAGIKGTGVKGTDVKGTGVKTARNTRSVTKDAADQTPEHSTNVNGDLNVSKGSESQGKRDDTVHAASEGKNSIALKPLGDKRQQAVEAEVKNINNDAISPGGAKDKHNDSDVLAQSSAGSNADQAVKDMWSENDEFMSKVSKFSPGSWFEMKDEQGVDMRCRLAAVIRSTGRYIFVNRSGMKVADKTHQDLADALKNNKLSLLDSGMLFDRALENVVSGLRKK